MARNSMLIYEYRSMGKESMPEMPEMLLFQLPCSGQSEPNVVQLVDLFVHIRHGEVLRGQFPDRETYAS